MRIATIVFCASEENAQDLKTNIELERLYDEGYEMVSLLRLGELLHIHGPAHLVMDVIKCLDDSRARIVYASFKEATQHFEIHPQPIYPQ